MNLVDKRLDKATAPRLLWVIRVGSPLCRDVRFQPVSDQTADIAPRQHSATFGYSHCQRMTVVGGEFLKFSPRSD